jgi:hypothetical protein
MERHWFKAKTYGWGWTPSTWQAWVIMFIYVGTVVLSAVVFLRPGFGRAGWMGYGAAIAIATALLIVICYKTGEKPRWPWGKNSQKQ